MILGALLSFLSGGVLRYVPDVLKLLDKGGERKHELAMQDKAYASDKLHAESGLAIAQAQAASAHDTGDAEILRAALEAQGRPSGVPWIDGLSAFIRPFLTLYWCVFLYSAVKVAQFIIMVRSGMDTPSIILALWSPGDMELVVSMIGFWFADRGLRSGHSALK